MLSEKNSNALLVVLLFSLTIFFFAPLLIYFTNRFEFPFVFSKVVPYFISATIISIILVIVLLFILPRKICKNAVLIIFILSFLMWFQGNILVWNYSVFDGHGIDWNKNYFRGIIDTGIWLSCLIIGLRKSGFIFKILRRASIWLILIQLVSLIFVMAQVSDMPSAAKYRIKTDTFYNFSKRRNIIILVIDAFQSDVFQEIIDEDKTYEDIFRGFTYFPNAVSGFPNTYPSVPLILTGSFYDNSIGIQEFIKNEFLSRSLPKFLQDYGFRVELYPFFSAFSVYCDPRIASNFEPIKKRRGIGEQIVFIYDIALFRYSPHFVKQFIYDNQKWFLRRIVFRKTDKNLGLFNFNYISPSELSSRHSTTRFFKELVSYGTVNINQGVFKYIHLLGMHPPLLINEQLQNELLPYNRQNYKRQAKGFLKLLSLFLGKLDDMGVYDSSLILILGDHGGRLGGVYLPKDKFRGSEQKNRLTPYSKGMALPLVLIKPFNSESKMQINYAPISLSDIPKTVTSQLGLRDGFSGTSVFEIKESDKRIRRYFSYDWKEQDIKDNFLPVMTEYVVSGFSWLEESWHATGRKLTCPKRVIYQPNIIWRRIKKIILE